MLLTAGAHVGPYEILAAIGAGGMGEVYRARDTKLERDVAIKILPAGFAADADRLARFEREARTLAALNHPNIAHIHGVEESSGVRAIVMELVEGDNLSERLARGPIPIAEALSIARQIADAVQTAHDHGVIHRDLKPANVKVTSDGAVKLLDFGLAKVSGAQSAGALSQSPTVMMSMPGTLLGTAAYMSPEQVKGHSADARSDVWAFGCLLFEMLTGQAAFAAPTMSEIVANVLTREPGLQQLPADTPHSVRRVLRRCLEKNPANRLRAVADARLDIDDAQRPEGSAPYAPAATRSRAERLAWASAVLLLGLVALGLTVWPRRSAPAAAEVRFDIVTPDVGNSIALASVALAPNGQQILFVADSDGQPHVWLRPINSVSARPLPGTGGGAFPFWSPDARSIAFVADGLLKRLDLDGGLVRSLARTTVPVGGTWGPEGILFARNPASPIVRLSSTDGSTVEVTRLDAGQVGHSFPHWLPDGRHFLFYAAGAAESRGVYVGQLDDVSSRRLVNADGGGAYSNGHLLFIRQANVFAQPFDVDRLELKGSPFQVAEGVFGREGGQFLTLSAAGGAFAFRAGRARFERQFAWFDRSGRQIATVGERLGDPDGVSWSPDRNQLVFFERRGMNSQLWMLDVRRGIVSRFTDDRDEDIFPLWTRDGSRIVYTAVRNGQMSVNQIAIGGGRPEELMSVQNDETFASDTSPDGRYIVYQRMNAKTGWDLWAMPREANAKPVPIVQTNADERGARLSPDGRWIAYVSNDSGVSEIYVQPFPGPGRRVQVSTKGGDEPQWRADGVELFYLAVDGKLMATPITHAVDHQSLDIGVPVPLFSAQVGLIVRPILAGDYMASSDGQRFLVNRLLRDAGGTPVRVVVNWKAGQ